MERHNKHPNICHFCCLLHYNTWIILMARSTTNNLLIYYITAEMKVAVLEEYDMNQWVQFGKWDIVTRWFLWAPVMEYGVADKSPIFPSLSDGKLLHWRLMTSCRAILRVCSLFASFHRCCRCYGMRFLRGRVEVVDSLATTTRMVISRHVQSGNFTPSLFNKCVVINSLAHVLPDNNGLSGLFRAHFHVAIIE